MLTFLFFCKLVNYLLPFGQNLILKTVFQTSDSPPDKTENTFSTPVPSHKKKVSPNFNIRYNSWDLLVPKKIVCFFQSTGWDLCNFLIPAAASVITNLGLCMNISSRNLISPWIDQIRFTDITLCNTRDFIFWLTNIDGLRP